MKSTLNFVFISQLAMYVITQYQVANQAKFLCGVSEVEIQSFFSPWPVAIPRLTTQSAQLFTYSFI